MDFPQNKKYLHKTDINLFIKHILYRQRQPGTQI